MTRAVVVLSAWITTLAKYDRGVSWELGAAAGCSGYR